MADQRVNGNLVLIGSLGGTVALGAQASGGAGGFSLLLPLNPPQIGQSLVVTSVFNGNTANLAWGSATSFTNGRIIGTLADGTNSVGASGQLLSSTGIGTIWVAPPRKIQTVRVPFTPTPTDVANGYMNVAVVFPQAFADANYTLTTDLELVTSGVPLWQANHLYAAGSVILDTNGMLQQSGAQATSGGTQPVWQSVSGGTNTDGGVTWTLNPVSSFDFIGIAKFKTASGFTEETFADIIVPMILHVTATHD